MLTVDPSVATKFWGYVEKTDGCWLWQGPVFPTGYGWFCVGRNSIGAHRVAYALTGGVVAEGLELDHLCRVRHCVNPHHLEPVTKHENWRRGVSPTAVNARKTHCNHGHPYDLRRANGHRRCRTCRDQQYRRMMERRGDEIRARGRAYNRERYHRERAERLAAEKQMGAIPPKEIRNQAYRGSWVRGFIAGKSGLPRRSPYADRTAKTAQASNFIRIHDKWWHEGFDAAAALRGEAA